MQEESIPAIALRSGKGIRLVMDTKTYVFFTEALGAFKEAWETCSTTGEAFECLRAKWGNYETDSYGDRTWIAIPYRSEDEIRVTVVFKNKRLGVDIREWFQPH
jgi:hypothetical protein